MKIERVKRTFTRIPYIGKKYFRESDRTARELNRATGLNVPTSNNLPGVGNMMNGGRGRSSGLGFKL